MHQYYAHPQNHFWRIMEALFQIPASESYDLRCRQLMTNKLALWDVCQSACRLGSLDSAIEQHTVIANDFSELLASPNDIHCIAFNGQAAARLFKKHIQLASEINTLTLPSTSPANAATSYEEKLQQWRILQTLI